MSEESKAQGVTERLREYAKDWRVRAADQKPPLEAADLITLQATTIAEQAGEIDGLTRELGAVADFVERHWQGAGLGLESGWIIREIAANEQEADRRNAASEALVSRLKEALEAVLPYAEDTNDAGPRDEGWQSDALEAKCRTAAALLSELGERGE